MTIRKHLWNGSTTITKMLTEYSVVWYLIHPFFKQFKFQNLWFTAVFLFFNSISIIIALRCAYLNYFISLTFSCISNLLSSKSIINRRRSDIKFIPCTECVPSIFISDAENMEIELKSSDCLNKPDISYKFIRDASTVEGLVFPNGKFNVFGWRKNTLGMCSYVDALGRCRASKCKCKA